MVVKLPLCVINMFIVLNDPIEEILDNSLEV